MNREDYQQRGLYDPAFEHDACGIGAVVDIKGRQSYETVDSALKIVEKLEHRAGKDAEGKTGDGVGILLQISHQFFQKAATECGIQLGEARDYGVGMFFFPQDTLRRNQAKKMFEVIVAKEGMEFLAGGRCLSAQRCWARRHVQDATSAASMKRRDRRGTGVDRGCMWPASL